MLDPYLVGRFSVLALIGIISLFWAQRGIVNDFAYPLDGEPYEGRVSLLSTYLMVGWLFSLLGALVPIPGSEIPNTAATFGVFGVLFTGTLRLYSLSRGFALGRTNGNPPSISEAILVIIALGSGIAILFSGIGNLTTYVRSVAPLDGNNGTSTGHWNPQPESAILLISSAIFAVLVETSWHLWRRTPNAHAVAREAGESTVNEVAADKQGVVALEIFREWAKTPKIHSIDRRLRADYPATNLRHILNLLVEHGLVVPVFSGTARRHPHFHREQREAADVYLESIKQVAALAIRDVEAVLRSRIGGAKEGSAAAKLFSDLASVEGIGDINRLLDSVLRDLEQSKPTGRNRLLLDYLRLRYWDGMTVAQIAHRMSYSREHLTRTAHKPAIALFRQFLSARLTR